MHADTSTYVHMAIVYIMYSVFFILFSPHIFIYISAAVLTFNFPQGTNNILFYSIPFLPTNEKHEISSAETNRIY